MRKIMILAAAVAAILSGCVSAPMAPTDVRVTIAPGLLHKIQVTDVRCAKTAGSDFLTLQANVVNTTGRELPVEWKVQWLDGSGFEIDGMASTWRTVAVPAYDIKGLKSRAPRVDAADMRFYVREYQR